MKNKNIKIIGLIISIIAVIAIGTFAWLTWASQQNTDLYSNVGNLLEVEFTTGNSINVSDMMPTLDPLTNGEITTFSVKNKATYDFAIDIKLTITSISTELKSESLKYMILSSDTENGEYTSVASGNFTNMVVGDNIMGGDVIRAKNKLYYKFIVYIDGSMENNINFMGKALSGQLNVTAHENEPNPPALVDGLIPVKYDENNQKWVKADSTNTNNDWYNYKEKKWANAVLVRETGYEEHLNQTNKTVNIDNVEIVDKYTSSNQGIASSTSSTTFTFTTGSSSGTISFDYTVSSESNDKLTITLQKGNSTSTIVSARGGTYDTSYSASIAANLNCVLTVTYTKNDNTDSKDDEATISNINITNLSGEIIVAAVGDYGWTRSDRNLYPVTTYSSYSHYDDGTFNLISSGHVSAEESVGRYICSDTASTTCSTLYKIKSYSGNTITAVDEYNNNSFTARSVYQSASTGTEIKEEAILAYYVWIPRYKYKVWNINKINDVDSYNAETIGIDILFENNTESTGTIKCNYDFTITDGSLSEICSGSNGDYYTHPAFTFGDDELTGFWVGKFDISSETPDVLTKSGSVYYRYGGGSVTNLAVRVKPNVRCWNHNTATNFYKVIYDMQKENNIYGLNSSRSNTDSHMVKNMEWGAVVYLTYSKYGICNNNTCGDVIVNNSTDCITGNAGNVRGVGIYKNVADMLSGITNAYNTSAGQLASTTSNIYGVYDVTGVTGDYVMANMSSVVGSYKYNAYSAGSNYTYTGNEKYIDTYSASAGNSSLSEYNRTRLGDGIGENTKWSSANNYFSTSSNWFTRGGAPSINYSGVKGYLFYSYSWDGGTRNSYSSRVILVSLSSN